MATKKLLVCLGQSNGEPIGDENEWLILHPGLFYVAAGGAPTGSYNDNFTMPGSFPGFTTLNLMGRAGKESRYLTFYNPYATGYRRYPGMGLVASGSTATSINTEQTWIALGGQSFTITRAKTGEVRTVSTVAGTNLTVAALSSAPAADEQFNYSFVAVSGGSTTVANLNVGWPNVAGNPPKLTGVNIKCLTGANAGVERTIASIDGATGAITVSVPWANATLAGDTFELKPQGLTSSEWHKWGYFLPWCPYEGDTLAGKENPYPPGFNYPNGISAMRTYNPGVGAGICGRSAAWHHGAGFQISQLTGDDLRIVSVAVGGAALSYNEFAFSNDVSTGWWDPQQQCTFNPSTPNALFQRLMDVLDVSKLQAAAEGHTLEIVLVMFSQGEADASGQTPANAYEGNLRAFVPRIRQELVNRGFWPGSPEEIRWIQPKITSDGWPYPEPVRQAVLNVAATDPHFRTFETNGIPKGDVAHYSGVGQTQIENLVVETLRQMIAAEEAGTATVTATPTPAEIVAAIDASMVDSLIASFPGNGGQITFATLKEKRETRSYYAALVAAKTGPRKTIARFR